VEALDLPSEPEEPGKAERARDRGAERPRARDLPDPDERGCLYEAMRAHVSAETRDEAGYQAELASSAAAKPIGETPGSKGVRRVSEREGGPFGRNYGETRCGRPVWHRPACMRCQDRSGPKASGGRARRHGRRRGGSRRRGGYRRRGGGRLRWQACLAAEFSACRQPAAPRRRRTGTVPARRSRRAAASRSSPDSADRRTGRCRCRHAV
jgi:hypothetical protein